MSLHTTKRSHRPSMALVALASLISLAAGRSLAANTQDASAPRPKQACEQAPGQKIVTTVTYNSWEINYGTAEPEQVISTLAQEGGACSEQECKLEQRYAATSQIFPGVTSKLLDLYQGCAPPGVFGFIDNCSHGGKIPALEDYKIFVQVVEAENLNSTRQINAFVEIAGEAIRRSNKPYTPKESDLRVSDRENNGTRQNFNVNYIRVESWDGDRPIGKLGVQISTEPSLESRGADMNNAGLQGASGCVALDAQASDAGKGLTCYVPQAPVDVNFFGAVTAKCQELPVHYCYGETRCY